LTLFEALAHGVPAIAVPQYEHQERTIRRLARRRALVPIDTGDGASVGERVRTALTTLLADAEARAALRRRALEVVDGQGLRRVAELCLVVEPLAWDSSFFGIPIAAIHPRRLNERLLAFALGELKRLGIECAYYLADSDDPESIRLAELAGFHFVDVRLTFERSLDDAGRGGIEGVREARRDDIPALEAIASRAYKQSRYFFDWHFDRVACRRFYSDWIRKCVTGELPARVFVVDDDEGPAGYIALTYLSLSTSSIILVGVADRAKGQGVGRRLVTRGLQWAADAGRSRMEVVTQGRNYEAQRLYQRCGFVTARTEVWYHWWSRR
jgi:dTDP-4-amino-4,6-dideoxy-D-galactose acyltransferase